MSENVGSSTVEIVKNNGYAVEVHDVVTEDGYILELHRISGNKSGQEPTRKHPVFIHHGILGSSADWVLGGADISLPMQLSDLGYDVWLANCRGNTYSRKHSTMTSKQRDYWNFSLHEVGTLDLPASFDYILMKTNTSQLHYVGYSMGTSVFFIMASERPEYHHKIRSQISLAPVAYVFNTRSSIRHLAPYAEKLNDVMRLKSQLPKLMDFVSVDSLRCNHVDFLWSLDVTKQVNAKVTEILQKTDHVDWEYTGPSEDSCMADVDGTGDNDSSSTTKGRQPNSTDDHHEYVNFAPVPDHSEKHSSSAIPVQQRDDKSAELARKGATFGQLDRAVEVHQNKVYTKFSSLGRAIRFLKLRYK